MAEGETTHKEREGMSQLQKWMDDGSYLPQPLRDFHDQKDCFKAMHSLVAVERHEYTKEIKWVDGQCYVIDIFLWFMAKRGWTLQRSRQKLEFESLEDDISAVKSSE